MAVAEFDVFFSHAWADGERPQQLADALTKAGLRVWFDAAEINDFASITHAVTEGLAKSKTLLAYYSKTYPLRRACQWELTAAFLAAQTEGDPRRRVLVINAENGADHIHPVELRDAKFRNAPKNDREVGELAEAIRKQIAAVEDPFPNVHPLDPPPWYGIKPVRYERFVGRFQEMWKIHSALHETKVVQVTGASGQDIAQVTGLGGIGKSLLAREYALRFGPAYPGGIFWMSAYGNDDAKAAVGPTERETLRADQVRQIAERLGISAQGLAAEQIEGELARKIGSQGKACLWLVDDVPSGLDTEALRRWFAPHPLARTLITTRSGEYGSLAKGIDLSVLTPDEADQLLTSRRKPLNDSEKKQARELANDLGYHALALDVSASALKSFSGNEPYRQFREELADQDDDALEMAKLWGQDLLPNGHEKSIAQTMLRSIRGLGVEGLDFLRLASVLAVAPIPGSLVTAVFETADGLERGKPEERQRKAFAEVDKASLAEIAGEDGARSVHTLVSRAVRFHEKASPERTQALRAAAVEALRSEIAIAAPDPKLHEQIEFHVAHARRIALSPTTVNEANLLKCVVLYDNERGAYASGRTLCEREVNFRCRVQGPKHPDTLASMQTLAYMLWRDGNPAEAGKWYKQVLSDCRRVLGADDRLTPTCMSNLALTLRDLGDLAEARNLEGKALATRLRVLGADHPDTLHSMNNLAQILRQQDHLSGACKLQKKTLEMRRSMLGPEHKDTLTSMNNLANLLYDQADFAAARKLYEEVLEAYGRLLGPEHPYTLRSMNNLAGTLQAQRDLAGARKLQEKVLAGQRRVLGTEHPDTLQSMNNLAGTLQGQRDLTGARKLQEEVLDLFRRIWKPEHPNISVSAWNLFGTLLDLGENEAARDVLERDLLWLLDRDPDTLGPEQRKIREMVAQAVGKTG